ncbi:hypothetical protein [Chitinophaga rhizophila]|uniref:Uncharacterized protein n=1 Tax=Chitinophaga rhizophila TaxID=2866212 RepID=A0ABS7G552_9BACT|nr:hypothetical protein [Chitinophaga rhizophila]MBW8682796.1 hypothetical protein [Chitinophaga rhizophila]
MMTRQITVSYNDQHYMYDVAFERQQNATVYHIKPLSKSVAAFPEHFDIIKADDNEEPQYNLQTLSEEGKQIADVLWQQIALFPPQFKGGKA